MMMRLVTATWILLMVLFSGRAEAYPWMIEHQYTTCSQCHVDPSGGSAMTAYGRAQTEALLRSPYGQDMSEPGKVKDFAFGLFKVPDAVIAQADVRSLLIPQPGNFRYQIMQADLRGGVQTEKFVAYASAGVVSAGGRGARILSEQGKDNEFLIPVLRDYWVGFVPKNGWLIRAGRINLPFGIRTDQHLLFTRTATRTTTNTDQQLGLSASVETRHWRAELMGIAGNPAVSPDSFRERGYSGFFAYAVDKGAEVGVSSLVASSKTDIITLVPSTRQVHGVFARYSPFKSFGLLAEADMMLFNEGVDTRESRAGVAIDLQADYEVTRGVHLKGGGEFCDTDFGTDGASRRGWGAVQWFFAPHVSARFDALVGPLYCTPGAVGRPMALATFQAFL